MKTVHVSDTSKELMRMPCCYYDNNGGGKACDSRVVCTRYKLKATFYKPFHRPSVGERRQVGSPMGPGVDTCTHVTKCVSETSNSEEF